MLGLGEKRILLKICHAYHVVLFGYTVPEGWLHACSAEEEGIKVNPIELSQFVDFIKCDKLQTESFVIGTNQCKCFLWVQCAITIPNICLLSRRIGWRGMILLSVIKEFKVVLYGSTENWKVVMNFDSKVFNIWTVYVFLLLTLCAFFITRNGVFMRTENRWRKWKKIKYNRINTARTVIDVIISVHEKCSHMLTRKDLIVYESLLVYRV